MAKLIDQYKFHQVREAHKVLAELLNESLPDFSSETVIVPVPTIAGHIRQRGYDHMLLIARRFARRRGLPVRTLLVRRSNAVQHFAKTAGQRRSQAKRFFEVHGKPDPKKHYLILDDIFTTGATVEAAAGALKKAGAVRVSVAVIARQGEA